MAGTITTRGTSTPGEGWQREAQSELFMTAVSTLDSGTAHEGTDARALRMRELTRRIATDPGMNTWTAQFTHWLRDDANMRRSALIVACEYVKARLDAGIKDETSVGVPGLNRVTINIACERADEPGTLLTYWMKTYGRNVPAPVKRGVADAVTRLYGERAALKYSGGAAEMHPGDVIELVHPKPKAEWQGVLFEHLLNSRHGHKTMSEATRATWLPIVHEAMTSRASSKTEADRAKERARLLKPGAMREAGMTWEHLSGLGPMDSEAWEAAIPVMGYMALLKNLRNFDQAGISVPVTDDVKRRLTDPDQVARSRQLPFRFYTAAKNADRHWQETLGQALELSCKNIPVLEGMTLVLVDCSQSMSGRVSKKSTITRREVAGLFGSVLASRCENVVLARYGSEGSVWGQQRRGGQTRTVEVTQGPSVLATAINGYPNMGGTETGSSLHYWLNEGYSFDRLVVLTDEQVNWGDDMPIEDAVPASQRMFTFNLAGDIMASHEASENWHAFGGLTDQAYGLIPMIEAGGTAKWPWEK